MTKKTEKKTEKKKQKRDPFFKLKYIGYCLSNMPPSGAGYADFIEYARFQLAHYYKVPVKDDIWNRYADEELLTEYYAVKFMQDEELTAEFEQLMNLDKERLKEETEEIYDWFDEQIEQNKIELQERLDAEQDELDFKPSDIGEKDG